jgi:dolichyl-phosphate beta-glucosyltransferase
MDISIIIPVLNEEKKIANDILATSAFLVDAELSGEIIIVDDGSTDASSRVAIQCDVPESVSLKIIRYEYHRGKGHAVRMGITDSRGDYVMFMDSGGNVPLYYISSGLELITNGHCHIAMGSRKLPQSNIRKNLVWYRRITSKIFALLVRYYFDLPENLTDTQCGFKLYNGEIARELYGDSLSDGFTFDLEIILRAKSAGYKMLEFPIEWSCDRDSRLSLFSTGKIFRELKRIKKLLP